MSGKQYEKRKLYGTRLYEYRLIIEDKQFSNVAVAGV